MEINCPDCGNTQKYHPKSIPKRPKTQCKNKECGKWIYIKKSELTKNDQNIDQTIDQKKQEIDQKLVRPADPDDQIDQIFIGPGSKIDQNIQKDDQNIDQKTPGFDQENDQKYGQKIPGYRGPMIENGLDYRILLTAVNNFLIGYKKAYQNAKSRPFSEVKLKYESMLKQKEILEAKIK